MKIGIIAPSSVAPKPELEWGVKKLKSKGFQVQVHSQVNQKYLFFSGTDKARAKAILDFAHNPQIDILWCARGGYGSARLLQLLKKSKKPKTKKLLVGLSDATALLAFVQKEWGWSALHAPMPALKKFQNLTPREEKSLFSWVKKKSITVKDWNHFQLKFLYKPKEFSKKGLEAKVQGGNLSVLMTLLKTPFQPKIKNQILFLEDVDEPLYRLDRMVHQALSAGYFEGVKAIVLGSFHHCQDYVLVSQNKKPVRAKISEKKFIAELFKTVGKQLNIPVLQGLPVGHGDLQNPLPLGARYKINAYGQLELLEWKWLES